jgi:hypothetical protein
MEPNDAPVSLAGRPTTSMELALSVASDSTEPSPRSPILLDLSSPHGQPTAAWRLVERWQDEALRMMERPGVAVERETWCVQLEEELKVMLKRLHAHAVSPDMGLMLSPDPAQVLQQPSAPPSSTISTEQETPATQELLEEPVVAKPRRARAVSPTFDGSEEEEVM